jgi:uncharacterized damage-inducible protein DinB
MNHPHPAIEEGQVPQAVEAAFQHVLDTYASETNKLIAVWQRFTDEDLGYRPHAKSSTVAEILKHELLSSRRFFGEFLGGPERAAEAVLPSEMSIQACCERMRRLARKRLEFLASRSEDWWLSEARFFDVNRQRIWIFWRRVLHTAHHRTQLTMYLRMSDRDVPAVYGPTADETWSGADPTQTSEAAGRG